MTRHHMTPKGPVAFTAEEEAEWDIAESNEAQQQAVKTVADKIAKLWQAADAYIYQYINGMGLAILAAGVQQGGVKAKSVAAWSDAIWAEYYARKSLITVDSVDNFDFSSFGPMPHTILELREEVMVLWGGA